MQKLALINDTLTILKTILFRAIGGGGSGCFLRIGLL